MKSLLTFFSVLVCAFSIQGQTITNGTFDAQASGWGCNPEAHYRETTYGGFISSNRVAEIDAAVGLCQTISGFVVGETYTLTFDCSRRTNCGPTLQSMNVTIDGSALDVNISRNGTPFRFENESFNFIATATSHTITFDGTSPTTCGLIVDNIALRTATLPIELMYFEATAVTNDQVELSWQTAMELNNSHFTIERSNNGMDWQILETIEGAGNSTAALDYKTMDDAPMQGISYYRLKQTDFDGQYSYSNIQAVELETASTSNVQIYPNPTQGLVTIKGLPLAYNNNLMLFNSLGQAISVRISSASDNKTLIDLSGLEAGLYLLKTGTTIKRILKQ